MTCRFDPKEIRTDSIGSNRQVNLEQQYQAVNDICLHVNLLGNILLRVRHIGIEHTTFCQLPKHGEVLGTILDCMVRV